VGGDAPSQKLRLSDSPSLSPSAAAGFNAMSRPAWSKTSGRHDAHLRNAPVASRLFAECYRIVDEQYVEKTIRRLEVFDDVLRLRTKAEIREALERWKHCLYGPQVEVLVRWLDSQS
jgi:hypothetical protein